MSRFLLDTDTLTLLQRGHAVVTTRVNAQAATDVNLSAITIQEQTEGWLNAVARARTPQQTELASRLLVDIPWPGWIRFAVLPFVVAATQRFDQLRALRLNVGLMDLRIAAVALVNGLTVVTRNQRDFGRVPTLATVDWSI